LNVTPLHFCDVTVDVELWPVFGWAIDAPAGTILAHHDRPWLPDTLS
jgi:hypothetical protein